MLAAKCRELHGAEEAAITSSGMSALALVLLCQLEPGDHVVVNNQLYGRTLSLFTGEAARLGISSTLVDCYDLAAVKQAFTPHTRLAVVETISNPLVRVADLGALAALVHEHGAALLADNTLAGPAVCRPREFGADWIMESLTKTMNGHSDVILGLVCGSARPLGTRALGVVDLGPRQRGLRLLVGAGDWPRWRFASSGHAPTRWRSPALAESARVKAVHYPGLPEHPDHALARRQFGERFGTIVTFTVAGGAAGAGAFMKAAGRVPFCPSLGELSTTLSHPESTSHRGLTPEARAALGIDGGTIRLSVGIESPGWVIEAVGQGLAAMG